MVHGYILIGVTADKLIGTLAPGGAIIRVQGLGF